jgi:hypothetical protein
LTTAATAIFKNKNADVAGMVNTITEGSENDKVIIVNLPTGFTFKDSVGNDDTLFDVDDESIMVTPGSASAVTGLDGLPAGIVFDAAALTVTDSVLTLTISANSTEDYDVNQLVTFTIAKEFLLKGGVASTVNIVGRTVIIATNEAAPAAPAISGTEATNATNEEFLFAIVTGYADLEDYEISLNAGTNWTELAASTVITTPSITLTAGVSTGVITVEGLTGTYAVGDVQVRVKAAAASATDSVGRFPAGTPRSNTVAFTPA